MTHDSHFLSPLVFVLFILACLLKLNVKCVRRESGEMEVLKRGDRRGSPVRAGAF